MNRIKISFALLFNMLLFVSLYAEETAYFNFRMVPGNYLRIRTYTTFDTKTNYWNCQPNDHFKLASYKTHHPCGDRPDHYHQIWLFQAIKPGQTELVFTHEEKKHTVTVKILPPIPNPNISEAQEWCFNSHQ